MDAVENERKIVDRMENRVKKKKKTIEDDSAGKMVQKKKTP